MAAQQELSLEAVFWKCMPPRKQPRYLRKSYLSCQTSCTKAPFLFTACVSLFFTYHKVTEVHVFCIAVKPQPSGIESAHLLQSSAVCMLQVNPVEAKLAKWTRCNLSGEPLHPPCVADELGNLYNKDAMVQALVSKSLPGSLSYIASLKHLIDLRCLATLHVHE